MTTTARSTAVGVFDDRATAERAVDELRSAGFDASNIGFAGHGEPGAGEEKAEDVAAGTATGAITGGVAGGVLGALAAGLIPGVGPIISAGILTATAIGAGAGAAAGGLLGGLTGLGVPEDEAKVYEDEFKAGRTLVAVKAEGRYEEASSLLRQAGAREIQTGQAGMSGRM